MRSAFRSRQQHIGQVGVTLWKLTSTQQEQPHCIALVVLRGTHGRRRHLPAQHGWQHFASRCTNTSFVSTRVAPSLSEAERAMLRSQGGPLAACPFTCVPTSRLVRFDPQPFRILLLRRLRLPIPFAAKACRCDRLHDVFGHHQSACAVSGVLGGRAALESAAARVCREAGARVSTNVALVDARRWKERTYLELAGDAGRARLIVLAAEVGGRWSDETLLFLKLVANAKSRSAPVPLRGKARAARFRRWSAILSCSAPKAFALSLLDRRPMIGSDGEVPHLHSVLGDNRCA